MVWRLEHRESDVFWKLKRAAGWGDEKRIAADFKIVEKFADDIIAQKLGKMQASFRDVDGKQTDLMSLFLKHEPDISRKKLRDNAMNFIVSYILSISLCFGSEHVDCPSSIGFL